MQNRHLKYPLVHACQNLNVFSPFIKIERKGKNIIKHKTTNCGCCGCGGDGGSGGAGR